jgi:hypothetical protein
MVIVITSPSKPLDIAYELDDPDEVHIVPLQGREHELNPACWCHPDPDHECPQLYVHNLEQ